VRNAETQFELLAEQNSAGPFFERALFFAGESAMASMASQSLSTAPSSCSIVLSSSMAN